VGDILYIREPWAAEGEFDKMKPKDIPVGVPIGKFDNPIMDQGKDRPGRFMCKWMTRPERLLVTAVCEERLQDIDDEDARKEGVVFMARGLSRYHGEMVHLFKHLWLQAGKPRISIRG
jgi:hypothetical protein